MENGQPITEAERNLLRWKGGKVKLTEDEAIAAAAKLLITPKSVAELRLLVETTAANHHYNPIEKLIELTNSDVIDPKDKVSIHKALLPFLVPQLPVPKNTGSEEKGGQMKVVITTFAFPSAPTTVPLHQEKPAMVATEPQSLVTSPP